MKKILTLSIILFVISLIPILSQTTPQKVTDSNTPLHELQPDYKVPYGPSKAEDITAVLNRIYVYLDASTPAKVIDSKTKAELNDLTRLTTDAVFKPGVFRLISYEWGVTYGAMLLAGNATDDNKFNEYTLKRISLIADMAGYFKS
ncbi:MAG TPA: family 88 glycosyl hydrolase, partial [Bacteroidales bacterium]|nr:family 88 glycosyl hydrolase [Bacteroidales bacterium]